MIKFKTRIVVVFPNVTSHFVSSSKFITDNTTLFVPSSIYVLALDPEETLENVVTTFIVKKV